MKKLSQLKKTIRRSLTGGMAAALLLVSGLVLRSEEPKTDPYGKTAAAAQPAAPAQSAPPKKGKPAPKKLSGAELYSMHCNRCHPERYPAERTPAQWKTIVLHMRVRANIPAAQARTILTFLQENSGN